MKNDFFDEQNKIFFEFLDDMFSINKSKSWDEISRNITTEKIKRTYRKFAELFPRNFDYSTELEKSKNDFNTIHFGDIRANKIINEIVRFSLYADKILVFHPLQNPNVTNQKIDPRKNPIKWLPDFLDALYFYIVIQKWVKEGIVKLIINPTEYDFDLRDKIDSEVRQRMKDDKDVDSNTLTKTHVQNSLAEQFAQFYPGRSEYEIVQSLLKIDSPQFNLTEAEDFAKSIFGSMNSVNPLYKKINIPLNQNMIHPIKSGGPVESMLYLSEKTRGNIYTTSEMNWQLFNDLKVDDFWTKTNWLYSKIPLNFLNNVDTNFALEIRKEERLSGVRIQLKKIFSELKDINIENLNEYKIKEMQEEFIDAVNQSDAEWNNIQFEADNYRKYWLGANVGIPIITNELSFIPVVMSSLLLLKTEKDKVRKERLLKQKNALTVYIDLKNQKQSFFSILKNSVI